MPPTRPQGYTRQVPTNEANKLWRISGLGVELAAAVCGMALGGYLIDSWLNSSPIALLIGLTLGMVGGGYNFIRRAVALSKAETQAYHHANPHGPPKPPRPKPDGAATAESMFGRTVIDDDEDDSETSNPRH